MMTITTIISTSVKPRSRRFRFVFPAKAGTPLPLLLARLKAAGFPLSRE
jgi:hypothetical protein